jgi:shikimate kinase
MKDLPLMMALRSNDFPQTHLALIGYRGSGKSTVGPAVAALCQLLPLDADLEIERKAGKAIREIFFEQGESYFRDLETQTLRELVAREPAVLSLGGGVILREENRRLLKKCFTVWLTAPPEVLLRRLREDVEKRAQRPSLTGLPQAEETARLLSEREPFYASCADLTLKTDQHTVESAAETILKAWQTHDAAHGKR